MRLYAVIRIIPVTIAMKLMLVNRVCVRVKKCAIRAAVDTRMMRISMS